MFEFTTAYVSGFWMEMSHFILLLNKKIKETTCMGFSFVFWRWVFALFYFDSCPHKFILSG